MFRYTLPALVAGAIGALALAPSALAAEPAPEDLNPPPPSFLNCKPLGAGTICSGTSHNVKVSELQPELVCGSGAGVAVAACKLRGVRAAVGHDTYTAAQMVQHDDCNVLCLGARVIGPAIATACVRAFCQADFSGEERHVRRLHKIERIEER